MAQRTVWLCTDCTLFAVNGDLTPIDSEERAHAVEAGCAALGWLVADYEPGGDGHEEFGVGPVGGCAGCRSRAAGEWHRFLVGPVRAVKVRGTTARRRKLRPV